MEKLQKAAEAMQISRIQNFITVIGRFISVIIEFAFRQTQRKVLTTVDFRLGFE